MYVLVVVNEDNDEDGKGGRRGLGKDGDKARDCCGNCRGGVSINAGAVGRAEGRQGGRAVGRRDASCSAG